MTQAWTHRNQPVDSLPSDCVGFVYLITCHFNNRKYVGMKLAHLKRTRYYQHTYKNGTKKRRKRVEQVESDWQGYWGSCQELTKDIAELGHKNFSREILHFCTSKTETAYEEAREQFLRGVLLTDEYYNGIINCRVAKRNLKNCIKG